jgi:regulator of RNase E activity RraA
LGLEHPWLYFRVDDGKANLAPPNAHAVRRRLVSVDLEAGSIAPSHAFVRIEEYGTSVNVHGMAAESGDLIHADRHGAVVVPPDKVNEMMKALEALVEREARIICAANDPGMTVERIKEAMRG